MRDINGFKKGYYKNKFKSSTSIQINFFFNQWIIVKLLQRQQAKVLFLQNLLWMFSVMKSAAIGIKPLTLGLWVSGSTTVPVSLSKTWNTPVYWTTNVIVIQALLIIFNDIKLTTKYDKAFRCHACYLNKNLNTRIFYLVGSNGTVTLSVTTFSITKLSKH